MRASALAVFVAYVVAIGVACSQAQASKQRQVSVAQMIRAVFGPYADQALRVAWCESRLNIWATNGQYMNIFQMGYNERRTYGWHTAGSPAILAARAAYRYFVASGYSWRAWACQP